MGRERIAVASALAVGSWFGAYYYLTDQITRSSSIVKQTLFNLQVNPAAQKLLGTPVTIDSSVNGSLNQVQGFADIAFDCQGPQGRAKVLVQAHRNGPSWATHSLRLIPEGGSETISIITNQ